MSLSANLVALVLCAAVADGGEQPARSAEVVQEKLTLGELRMRLAELRDGQRTVILDTRELLRERRRNHLGPDRVESIAAKAVGRQYELCRTAKAMIARLDSEGTATAFVEVFQQVHQDMTRVAERLAKTDLGDDTRALQDEIVATLEEMIDALKSR
jgi:hypothetical protein